VSETPIEDLLDDLLRQTQADPRTTRRLLDEASDHLRATAAELQNNGMSRHEAEIEAVRRFGPITQIVHAVRRRSLLTLVGETLRAAIFLAGCGLAAVGISGLVALVMNALAGRSFVGGGGGGGGGTVFGAPGPSVNEVADDAVVLRVIAGLVGLFLLLGYLAWRRRASEAPLLPAGLIDALGAAAFAAATAVLAVVSVDQSVQTGTPGVGFPLSGALVALPACVYFCVRSARALIHSRTYPHPPIGVAEAE
jgi:hypothetical protein